MTQPVYGIMMYILALYKFHANGQIQNITDEDLQDMHTNLCFIYIYFSLV